MSFYWICTPCPFTGSTPTVGLGFVDLLCSDGGFREELANPVEAIG
jgi:hypothetical protein